MATKQEVLADEVLFQRACSQFVSSNVQACLSSLFYGMRNDMEAAGKLFDLYYEEIAGWFSVADWKEPVESFVDGADLEDLENIADRLGDWDDVIEGIPTAEEVTDDDGEVGYYCNGQRTDDEDDANALLREQHIDLIRSRVKALITDDEEYREIASDFDIDPEEQDVYEHWLVDRYFGAQLAERGELVFEFCNMTVWGRCTTGQSISLDGVIRSMVHELDEDHWLWREL